ncbi:MAG: PAS domain S-box protein, partial [Desulfuromonadaceae bacterium]|nr:PAS domain S-box protein [Desulfuromonadaceae bacterium]
MSPTKSCPIAACIVLVLMLIPILCAASPCLAATPHNSEKPQSIQVVMDDNYPPYVFRGDQGQLKGIIVDQWELWQKKTGIHVHITGMDWDTAQRNMQAGEFDVIDTMFRNEKRDQIYDFTQPYARLDVPLFFHEDISGIRGPKDLKGFLVAAKAGDSSIDILKKNGVVNIVEYPSYKTLIEAARDGKIKVFTVDRPPALYFLNKMGIQNHFRETRPLYYGEFHRAVLKGHPALFSTVENGFASISKADYDAIDARWMGSSIPETPYFRYILYGAGAIAALVMVLIAWLRTLKQAVSIKTRELADREEHHRSILQTAMSGICLLDMQGHLIEVNEAYCHMSGYSEQELLTMSIQDLEANESAEDTAHRIQMIREHGEAHFESQHCRKDGTVFDVEVRVTYLPTAGGQHVSFIHDITERKRAEEIIVNSNKLLQTIINNAPMRIFWKDTELRYLGCNHAFAEDADAGCPDNLIGKDDFQLAWKEHAELYRADDQRVIESGIPKLSYEEPQTTSDGSQTWLITSKVPLYNEAKEIIGVLGMYEDITVRKRSEKILLEQAELLDLTHDSIIVRTMDNVILFWNKGAEKQYGWKAEEVRGHAKTHDILHTIFPVPFDEIDDLLHRTGHWEGDLIHTRRNGSRIIVSSRWVLKKDENDVPVAIMEINNDITMRKQAEEEKILLEQQFQQTQRLESLGVLAGGIAHDFNNILAIIMGHCSLAQLDSKKAEDHIPPIYKASERAAGLCRQMLAYAGKASFTLAPVDVAELVSEMVMMLKATINQNVVIKFELASVIPNITGDASQIRQIVMNLIINASEAIGETHGVISVTLAKEVIGTGPSGRDHLGKMIPPGLYVCLEVSDTGCGMDEE